MKSHLLLLLFLTAQPVLSQKATRVISGLVTSKEGGHSIPGVLVYVKGTRNYSGTQQDGMFYIEVTDQDSILVFKDEDYQTKEIRLSRSCNYNVYLESRQDTTRIDETYFLAPWYDAKYRRIYYQQFLNAFNEEVDTLLKG